MSSGVKYREARQDRNRRRSEVVSLEEELRGQLVTLAADDLPLFLVPDLLALVEEQDKRERQAAEAEVIQLLLVERDRQLLEVLRAARSTAALLRQVSDHLAADRLSRQPAAPVQRLFAISVLWGLARASARPLPAVIDTPMARLDATHRQHLVERYFPNASHQDRFLIDDCVGVFIPEGLPQVHLPSGMGPWAQVFTWFP